MQLWYWTAHHLQAAKDADGDALYHGARQGVTFPLADALCWLLAARQFTLDVIELGQKGAVTAIDAEAFEGALAFFTDLCHVQVARASGEAARICAELVYGYNRHPAWDEGARKSCYQTDELIALDGIIPGIASIPCDTFDEDGKHPAKAGPCVTTVGLESFARLRTKLDGCLTGSQLARDRAAEALTKVMIPAALDYPQ